MSLRLSEQTTESEIREYLANNVYYNDLVEFILERGYDINMQDENGNTPLIFHSDGDTEYAYSMLEKIINAGADVNIQNEEGNTALMEACNSRMYFDNDEFIELLINAGTNLSIKNNEDETAYDIYKPIVRHSPVLELLQPQARRRAARRSGGSIKKLSTRKHKNKSRNKITGKHRNKRKQKKTKKSARK
jgi:ankyrin repeat protein